MLILTRDNYILLWKFPFYFIFLLQVLVIWSLRFVGDCSQGYCECMRSRVKLNYIRLILNRKEPYTVHAENKEKHNIEI